jgi:hypothetical protein
MSGIDAGTVKLKIHASWVSSVEINVRNRFTGYPEVEEPCPSQLLTHLS